MGSSCEIRGEWGGRKSRKSLEKADLRDSAVMEIFWILTD